MNSKVAIVECPSYEPGTVENAVRRGLELVGGLGSIVRPGNSVLLKVNALMDADPDSAATTHPSLVSAVIKEVKNLGATALVGDSPGNAKADVDRTMERAGFLKAAEKAGGEIVNFQRSKIEEIPSPSGNKRIKNIKICRAVLDADVIINLPKLKTHNWTLFTGAVKNMFGAVPGFNKSRYHILSPQPYHFSESLVDILEIAQPQLNIMDAVMGMEGRGPSAGDRRFMGALFFSADAVAMDAVCSAAIGYAPFAIDTTRIAHERKLGEGKLENIEIAGVPLSKVAKKDWKHSANTYSLTKNIPGWLNFLLRPVTRLLRIDPVIDQKKCEKCMICVENCPAKTIFFNNNKVEIDLSQCIMCFCCAELCPYRAVKLKRSWLTRKMGIAGPEYD